MKTSQWGFAGLWQNHLFTNRLISITFDEGHCISKWASFQMDSKQVDRLRYLLPRHIRFYVVSATTPAIILRDIMTSLQIRKDKMHYVHWSNARHNIALTVRWMAHPASSFHDLAFLLPEKPPPMELMLQDYQDSRWHQRPQYQGQPKTVPHLRHPRRHRRQLDCRKDYGCFSGV